MELEKINHLKIKTIAKLGISIKSQNDLLLLKDNILLTTHKEIGYNTLRRFFGYLPSTAPQKKTIEILQLYSGSTKDVNSDTYSIEESSWECWFRSNSIQISKTITTDDIQWLIDLKNHEDYFIYLSSILKEFIRTRNFKSLQTIFNTNDLFEIPITEMLKITSSVGTRLRTYTKNDFEGLNSLVKLICFRKNIMYLFVDYEHLNGYYGWMLEQSKKIQLNDDEWLFTKLITNFHLFLCGNTTYENLYYEKIPMNCHPVLYGRYWAYQLLYFENQKIDAVFQTIVIESNKIESKIEFFHEIIPTLILLKRIDLIQEIMALYFDKLFHKISWNQGYLQVGYLIGQAFMLLQEKHYELANSCFKNIDFSVITVKRDYLKLFFIIAKFNYYKLTSNDFQHKKELKKDYFLLVEKSGFYYFTEDFLEHYFYRIETTTDSSKT